MSHQIEKKLTSLESFSVTNKLAENLVNVAKTEPQTSACKKFTHNFLKPVAAHVAFFAASFFAAMADTLIHLGLFLGKAVAILATLPIRFFVQLPKDLDPSSPLAHLLTAVRSIAITPVVPFVGLASLEKAYELTLIGAKATQLGNTVELKELHEKLAASNKASAKLEAEIHQLNEKLLNLQKNPQGNNHTVENLQAELLIAREEYAELLATLGGLEDGGNNQALEKALKADRDVLQARVAELEGQVQASAAQTAELQNAQRQIQQLTADVEDKEGRVQDLFAQLEQNAEEAQALDEKFNNSQRQIEGFTLQIQQNETLINQLRSDNPAVNTAEVERLQKLQVQLQRELNDEKAANQRLIEENNTLKGEKAKLEAQIHGLTQETQTVKGKLAQAEAKQKETEAELKRVEGELERSKADLGIKEAELASLQNKYQTLEQIDKALATVGSKDKGQIANQKAKIAELEAQVLVLHKKDEEIEELKTKIDVLNNSIEIIKASSVKDKTRIAELQAAQVKASDFIPQVDGDYIVQLPPPVNNAPQTPPPPQNPPKSAPVKPLEKKLEKSTNLNQSVYATASQARQDLMEAIRTAKALNKKLGADQQTSGDIDLNARIAKKKKELDLKNDVEFKRWFRNIRIFKDMLEEALEFETAPAVQDLSASIVGGDLFKSTVGNLKNAEDPQEELKKSVKLFQALLEHAVVRLDKMIESAKTGQVSDEEKNKKLEQTQQAKLDAEKAEKQARLDSISLRTISAFDGDPINVEEDLKKPINLAGANGLIRTESKGSLNNLDALLEKAKTIKAEIEKGTLDSNNADYKLIRSIFAQIHELKYRPTKYRKHERVEGGGGGFVAPKPINNASQIEEGFGDDQANLDDEHDDLDDIDMKDFAKTLGGLYVK